VTKTISLGRLSNFTELSRFSFSLSLSLVLDLCGQEKLGFDPINKERKAAKKMNKMAGAPS